MDPAAPAPALLSAPLGSISETFSLRQIFTCQDDSRFTKAAVLNALNFQFGPSLVGRVVQTWQALGEHLSARDVKQLLVVIAAEVRKEDLEELFLKIIRRETPPGWLTLLPAVEREEIERCNHFDQLTEAHLIALVGLYRNVTTEKDERHSVAGFFPGYSTHGETSIFARSLSLVRACANVENYLQKDHLDDADAKYKKKMAGYEHLAREIVYKFDKFELSSGLIVPVLGEDAEIRLFKVSGAFTRPGLYFYTLLPLTENQWKKDGATCPVYCCFRGTADMDAWRRNLTEGTLEAGKYSYATYEAEILKCLCDTLQTVQPQTVKYRLFGTGHSLAAADIMRLLVTIFAHGDHADPRIREALHRIAAMQIVTWNPACLVWSTIERYLTSRHKLPVVMAPPCHNYVDEDIVSLAGLYLLGHDPALPPATVPAYIAKFTFGNVQQSVGVTNFTHRTPILNNQRPISMVLTADPVEANRKLRPRGFARGILGVFKGAMKNISHSPIATRNLLMWSFSSYLTQRPVTKPGEEKLDEFKLLEADPKIQQPADPEVIINESAVYQSGAEFPPLNLEEQEEMEKIRAEMDQLAKELGCEEQMRDWEIIVRKNVPPAQSKCILL